MTTTANGNDVTLRDASKEIADLINIDDNGLPVGGKSSRDKIEDEGGAVDRIDADDAQEDSEPSRPREAAEGDEAEDIGDDDAVADEPETEAINSVSDIARELGVDPEELLEGLTHSVKASGKAETVTLAELVKGYQRNADYNRKTQTLADARRAFESEQQQRLYAYQQQATVHAQQMAAVQGILQQELQSPELLSLQQTDPATYLMKTREIEGRLGALEQQRQMASQQYEAQMQQALTERTAREARALNDKVPDWGQDKLGQAVDVIRSLGFQDQEFAQNPDHRVIMAALELKELREKVAAFESERQSAKKTARRVKENVPNAPKPGRQRNGRLRVERDKLSQAKKRLQKSAKSGGRSNLTDAASVIENLLSQ